MRWGRMHEGIDIAVPLGTAVRAAAAGTVIYAGWMGGYGNLVVVDHGNGLATAYAHNSSLRGRRSASRWPQGEVVSLRRLHRATPPARTSTSRCASTAARSTRSGCTS